MMPDYESLFYWVRERERIRIVKSRGDKPPYSKDPIFNKYRFCNVRREDDSVTRWIDTNIRRKFEGDRYLWLMLCIARQINWPTTIGYLIETGAWPSDRVIDKFGFEPADITAQLHKFQIEFPSTKMWTGAYMISAPPQKGASKNDYIGNVVIGGLWDRRAEFSMLIEHRGTVGRPPMMRDMHALIRQTNGWGHFMAYQACVDMRFTRIMDKAPDRYHWCAAGPGTIRGLNRLYGRPLKHTLSQPQALREIRDLYHVVENETGVDMDFSDVPNILCEYDKYTRVELGEGKPRAKYVPGRGW